jgi:D-cysteine desulfhydrase family pyridoxal phosphate-dependent enzyme
MNHIPRLHFAHLPTPIEPLPRLSAALGGPNLWIKRDDQTGLALGGNKTRKLEFLVAQAQADGARTLITAGAVQSNHCRQTAAAAARFGFDCILVLSGDKPGEANGNYLLDDLLGAQIVWTTRPQRDAALQQTFDQAWADGRRPYLIPYGGSSPAGALGYLFAMQELMEQCSRSEDLPVFDWVVFASSSGGTHAGLAAGARLFGFPGKVLGISIDEKQDVLQARVAALASQTTDLLGEPQIFAPEDILANADYLGGGYGVMGQREIEAIHLFASTEGVLLDPVYTGRSAAGLIDLIRLGNSNLHLSFRRQDQVLFWHTGGAPALFVDRYRDMLIK